MALPHPRPERTGVTAMLQDLVLIALFAAASAGLLYMALGAALAPPAPHRRRPTGRTQPAVTILKPLHGDEAGLLENLASFCEQSYSGPVQIVFGVARDDDPAIAVVEQLRATYPHQTMELVVDGTVHGT